MFLRRSQAAHVPPATLPLLRTGAASLDEDVRYLLRLERALGTAAFISGCRERAETAKRRNQTMREYVAWLETVPSARRPGLLTSTGFDVLQFLVEDWGLRHVGRHPLPNGICQATPGYLAGAVASLATGFRDQGFSDLDNPALQPPVWPLAPMFVLVQSLVFLWRPEGSIQFIFIYWSPGKTIRGRL